MQVDPKLTTYMPGQSQAAKSNHYATLGLDRRCSVEQIRNAYRLLAKQYHPDLNPNSSPALAHIQEINAAYETLSDSARRLVYDQELADRKMPPGPRVAKVQRNIAQDLLLRLEEFLRGTTREVHVNDPANPNGPETYEVIVPPDTAPGTRFRLPRGEPFVGGFIQLRVRPLPGFRFKARGSDLRCDLKIKPQRATQGGIEMIPGVTGSLVRVEIPRSVGRLEILRISGEGLPKPRGGRGDLLVRVNYSVGVRFSRLSDR